MSILRKDVADVTVSDEEREREGFLSRARYALRHFNSVTYGRAEVDDIDEAFLRSLSDEGLGEIWERFSASVFRNVWTAP